MDWGYPGTLEVGRFEKDEGEAMGVYQIHRSRIWGIEDDGQINIVLFGNGVDIQLMEYLGSP